ncbi:hypothetical protein NO1_0195 [Candidatus Termititenax aidoneus]|uniref:Uncharacterized protein n=1 Tax=Termititenax aidoneus TaxID=2218524 RepID=A0A388TAI6_TERA1|nr:hypothetical protein NO1_0195 [Candidatus Termititenax aidoneus]
MRTKYQYDYRGLRHIKDINEHKDWWSARVMIARPNVNSVDNEVLEIEYIDGSHYGSDRVHVKKTIC